MYFLREQFFYKSLWDVFFEGAIFKNIFLREQFERAIFENTLINALVASHWMGWLITAFIALNCFGNLFTTNKSIDDSDTYKFQSRIID